MTPTPRGARNTVHSPRPGPLGRLAQLAYRRRGRVLVAWAVALAAAFGLSAAFGGDFSTGTSAPGSDSEHAQRLLSERFPAQSGDTVKVVVRADDVTTAVVQGRVNALLGELRGMPHVRSVENPYAVKGSVTPDGRMLVARVYLDVSNANDIPVEDTKRMLAAAETAGRDGVQVALGGLAVSSSLVGLAAAVVDVPTFAPTLGVVLGIALGIDYALLMVTRFREWRAAGLDPEAATVATLDTAGRAVLVAGGTVMVSMAGLFVTGLSIMYGTAVVTMVATLVVMLAAVTLFPAMLGYLGRRVDR